MSRETGDLLTIQALLERLVKFHLPRTLEVKKRIENGELLTDHDIEYLHLALEHAWDGYSIVANHAEYQHITFQLFELYDEIITQALENERAR